MIIYKEVEVNELPQIAKLYNMLAFELKETTGDCYFDFESLSDETVLEVMKNAVQQNSIKVYAAKEDTATIGFITGTIMNCFLPISGIKLDILKQRM